MKNKYRIGEIEKLFGFRRTTVRHYLERRLLRVGSDSNGYRFFAMEDLMQLFDIAYRRVALDFSLENVSNCLNADSVEECAAIFQSQKEHLEERIARSKISLRAITLFEGIFQRVRQHCGQTFIAKVPAMHFFPSSYVFNTQSQIFPASYPSARFVGADGRLLCRDLVSIVFEDDRDLLDESDLKAREEVRESGRYIYSLFKSGDNIASPKLFDHMLQWSRDHNFTPAEPYIVTFLFGLRKPGGAENYFEAYLPLAEVR